MSEPDHHHIAASELAAYLDGLLPEPRKSALEDHMAGCAECRRELMAAAALVHDAASGADAAGAGAGRGSAEVPGEPAPGAARVRPAWGRRRSWWVVGLAAAAAVATVLLVPQGDPGLPTESPLREAPAAGDALAKLTPRSPSASVTEEGVVLTLSWRPAAENLTYRLTVTDQGGAPLATDETTDTVVTLDPLDELGSGSRLFWYVDVTLANGETATTGVQPYIVP